MMGKQLVQVLEKRSIVIAFLVKEKPARTCVHEPSILHPEWETTLSLRASDHDSTVCCIILIYFPLPP